MQNKYWKQGGIEPVMSNQITSSSFLCLSAVSRWSDTFTMQRTMWTGSTVQQLPLTAHLQYTVSICRRCRITTNERDTLEEDKTFNYHAALILPQPPTNVGNCKLPLRTKTVEDCQESVWHPERKQPLPSVLQIKVKCRGESHCRGHDTWLLCLDQASETADFTLVH